jgi:hypothetical protein
MAGTRQTLDGKLVKREAKGGRARPCLAKLNAARDKDIMSNDTKEKRSSDGAFLNQDDEM